MGQEAINVYYEFVNKDLIVDVINNTTNNVTVSELSLIVNDTNEIIGSTPNFVVEKNKRIIFSNVPEILFKKNLKNTEFLIVKAISENKEYSNNKIRYSVSYP